MATIAVTLELTVLAWRKAQFDPIVELGTYS